MTAAPWAKRFRRRPRPGGFTFIEVLVAMAVMAIVLPIAMAGISLALQLSDNARQRAQAITLGNSELQTLVATDQWQTGQLSGDFSPDFPDYQWQAEVQTWSGGAAGSDPTMNQIDLVVTWTSHGQQRSVQLSTLVSGAGT